MTFSGVIAYPITPFLPGGGLDLESLELRHGQLTRSGVDGVVVLGTSGSFAYLSTEERTQVVKVAVEAASRAEGARGRWNLRDDHSPES